MIIRADAGVNWHELLSESHEKTIPVGSCILPVDGLVVRSPPQGCLVLEKSSHELDSIGFGDGGKDAELLHLEDPCFQ